ncbi:MAG: hypothetical protein M1834_008422 [Cirrosporium novae-zelandiae]|nr:MAG: hypothetical protein M1834_008422 [Cirrosporium novae-zelandiae]
MERGQASTTATTEPKAYKSSYCDVCDRQFKDERALQMHLRAAAVHRRLKGNQRAVPPTQQTNKKRDNTTSSWVPREPLVQADPDANIGTFQYGNNEWSVISATETTEALEVLSKSCHDILDLSRHHYLIRPYADEDIALLRKCKNCGFLETAIRRREFPSCCYYHPGKKNVKIPGSKHMAYSCCGKTIPSCIVLPKHEYIAPTARCKEYAYTPDAVDPSKHVDWRRRDAVVLDCEMAGVQGGRGEVVRLCMIDFLTGDTLVDTLVKPTGMIISWRTRYSGVSRQKMSAAESRGQVLDGWKAARAEVWKYVDGNTILVGQALHNDLDALRIIHWRVVDSAMLAQQAVSPTSTRQWGLKNLCRELLGKYVQNHGKDGHDCLEDVLATREVVLWCNRNPQKLQEWGKTKRVEEEKQKEAKKLRDRLKALNVKDAETSDSYG